MQGRLLTLKGVKPKGKVQWDFQALWLYGLVEPLTGESFFYEFCHLDTVRSYAVGGRVSQGAAK
jgi:hypothetical protein